MTSQPTLAIYDPNKHCYLLTDACKLGIGAVKQPNDQEVLLPVGYVSKKLLPYQTNYSVTELECLAIVESIDYFHYHRYNKHFTVITDHQPLKWQNQSKNSIHVHTNGL